MTHEHYRESGHGHIIPVSETVFDLTGDEKQASPQTVLVTGVTGFIGSRLVRRLLQGGHTVHGTCRNPNDSKKLEHLTSLPGASDRLKLFKADLLREGAFDEAMKGCTTVFHVASPFIQGVKKEESVEKLITPAVKGTENVLESINRCMGVTRCVLTSSCASVYGFLTPSKVVYTEEDWNEDCSADVLPYWHSKMLAERRAWEICKAQSRWSMAVMNPGLVVGAPLGTVQWGESISFVKTVMDGSLWPFAPPIPVGFVDVEDVCKAHILAMLRPQLTGRFLLVAESPANAFAAVSQWLRPRFDGFSFPKFTLAGILRPVMIASASLLGADPNVMRATYGQKLEFDTSRARNYLGIEFNHPKNCLEQAAMFLIENGHLKDQRKRKQ